MSSTLSQLMLAWYRNQARKLPWRENPDPYAIWVSEIMCQQTRVETVIPYFERWMNRFPTIADLANSNEQDVLQMWEGLGYYSRARNLHRAARIVMEQHAGRLPKDAEQLRKLPGIGRYSAGAIASIAFGKNEPALDGNIRRVLSRVFNLELPARSTEGEKQLWKWLNEILPHGNAGDFNQALMELGALVCTPRSPQCSACPVSTLCLAYDLGIQEQRPVMEPRIPVPHYVVAAAVIQRDDEVLLARRPSQGLLGGMWEFPGGKLENEEDYPMCLRREIQEELGVLIEVGSELGEFHHAYTHFKVSLKAFYCSLIDGEPQPIEASAIQWVKVRDLNGFPMGKIDRQIALRLSSNP